MTAKPTTLTLYPYPKDSCWVFDDERTGLKEEAFVLGATDMITRVVIGKSIPNAERGFALTFAAEPFEGHDVELHWLRPDPADGNWYVGDVAGQRMEAWPCPALLLYFVTPPQRIFVRCEPLPAGLDPTWTPPPGVTGRRFVDASVSGETPRPGVAVEHSTPGSGKGTRGRPDHVEAFFIPAKPTLIEGFRAFRSYLERVFEAKGQKLDSAWYDDGPDRRPYLYEDQPHLLKKRPRVDDQRQATY